jgi:hypothetical protein
MQKAKTSKLSKKDAKKFREAAKDWALLIDWQT